MWQGKPQLSRGRKLILRNPCDFSRASALAIAHALRRIALTTRCRLLISTCRTTPPRTIGPPTRTCAIRLDLHHLDAELLLDGRRALALVEQARLRQRPPVQPDRHVDGMPPGPRALAARLGRGGAVARRACAALFVPAIGRDPPALERERRALQVTRTQGDAVDAILKTAAEWHADLIGMPTAVVTASSTRCADQPPSAC